MEGDDDDDDSSNPVVGPSDDEYCDFTILPFHSRIQSAFEYVRYKNPQMVDTGTLLRSDILMAMNMNFTVCPNVVAPCSLVHRF